MGRDVPPEGVQFSESVWDGGIFHSSILERGSDIMYICLETGLCLSGKGMLSYLFLELESCWAAIETIFALQGFFIIAYFVLGLTELKHCKQFDIL